MKTKKSKGICSGQENNLTYSLRMLQALAPIKIQGVLTTAQLAYKNTMKAVTSAVFF